MVNKADTSVSALFYLRKVPLSLANSFSKTKTTISSIIAE